MSSILTNASAMTALQSLQATSKALEQTQTRISTGLRVAEASDNAAYWSIATTMRSDNKALGTVQDALGLGASRVDITYTAMSNTIDIIDDIKKNLISAKQPGLDRNKIQSTIDQLRLQIQGIASSATFSGPSWLALNSSPGDNLTQKIVSSFSRTNTGAIDIGTIDVDLSKIALFDAGTGNGILDGHVSSLSGNGGLQNNQMAAGTGIAGGWAEVTLFSNMSAGVTLTGDAQIRFNLTLDGASHAIVIDKAAIDEALSVTTGTAADAADMATVVNAALTKAGISIGAGGQVTVAATGNAVSITHNTNATTATLMISDATAENNGSYVGLNAIDITTASESDLDSYIASIDKMLGLVTVAASDMGAIKQRIDLQKDFASKLTDSIDKGVGQLVDADMNKESTRLQALQVQQQLGIQSLSIANANSQNILALFK